MGDGLRAIALGTNRSATTVLSAGLFHSCVVLDDSSLKCFGRNDAGQIGQGDKVDRGDRPNQMHDAFSSCVLLSDATVKCFGLNAQAQLGQGDTTIRGGKVAFYGYVGAIKAVDFGPNRTVRSMATGGYHVCAVLDDGSLKCFGNNDSGQLGLGDRLMRGRVAGEMGSDLPAIMF
jgi:alpha-tubulin suppressor-like RCC1 family protein